MSLTADLRTLYHLAVRPVQGTSHAERLDQFYRGQAATYDDFRRKLLHGREELYRRLEAPRGGVWIEMGGGTASNLDLLGSAIGELRRVYVVDLADSLLDVARERIARRGWTNVVAVRDDATKFVPAEGTADVVTFSYSLTMIPDWFAAIDHARRLLKPGGRIGVVDFFVSRKRDTVSPHGWWTRTFWPTWFALDDVWLCADHVPYLKSRFQTRAFDAGRGRVPYLPLGRVPYYTFVGERGAE